MNTRPLFSILHSSARPDKWRAVYDDWMSKAAHPENVEYVLCCDERWGFSQKAFNEDYLMNGLPHPLILEWNTGRRCYVDGVNTAARASSGSILIVNADDQFACEGWDDAILKAIREQMISPKTAIIDYGWYGRQIPFVVEVSTGTPDEHERGIMVMPILSRARYEAQGSVVFYPEYESMFADNDFCEWARQDGVVIDARHLMFPHKHPMFNGRGGWKRGLSSFALDDAYRAQNRQEAMQAGCNIFHQRLATKFGASNLRHGETAGESASASHGAPIRTIALCLPGEHFQGVWVDALFALYAHLVNLGFNVIYMRDYTSNVYVTREEIRQALLAADPQPDLALWLDDDNLCSPSQFDAILSDLGAHTEVDGITAWCWIHNEEKTGFHPSCGVFSPDFAHWQPFPNSLANETELKPVEVGGFPCFLMRLSAIEKAGERPFIRGILDESLPHGIGGEDLGFFKAAQEGGAKFLVDPRVRVPHLKYVTVEPTVPAEGKPDVKIAVMLRVKNEARWIGRVIEAVKELGPVFVMDDGSTDGTRLIASEHGAFTYKSDFIGQPLDEARDKNWLLDIVKGYYEDEGGVDWVLCIDGDEELQKGGVEKIRKACASNVADVFAIRVLNLWNRPDQARFDGVYGSMSRLSLFRVLPNIRFESMYEGKDAGQGKPPHTGLHTGNAPIASDRDLVAAHLNVFLLHYGPMLKEDRLRKYAWYNSVDPNNEIEDCYRHTVQGDVPEVPASAKLKHAGPLELRKLPKSIAPDFNVSTLRKAEPISIGDLRGAVFSRETKSQRPTFSILHPTARLPYGWVEAWRDWSAKCADPLDAEYIVCTDAGQPEIAPLNEHGIPLRFVTNHGRRCFVDAANAAAEQSTGRVLVQAEDDYFPCDNWDKKLLEVIPDLDGEYTVMVDAQFLPNLMGAAILTRPYYERYGYVYYPEYISMGADNDLTEKAIKDGVMIFADGVMRVGAKKNPTCSGHIQFEHRHPGVGKGEMDDVYRREQSDEAKALGWGLLPQRRVAGFPKSMGFTAPHAYFEKPEVREILRVNLGCSDRLETGFLNVDICEPADLVADLRLRWPWDDSSVDYIRAHDIIEHLPDKIFTMNEAFRVLKPGGTLDIIVPTTEGRGAFQDPTHVSFWNRNSFFYFEHGNPHLDRFERAYGMQCAYHVVSEQTETLSGGVTKLHIVLEAVKASQSQAAD